MHFGGKLQIKFVIESARNRRYAFWFLYGNKILNKMERGKYEIKNQTRKKNEQRRMHKNYQDEVEQKNITRFMNMNKK